MCAARREVGTTFCVCRRRRELSRLRPQRVHKTFAGYSTGYPQVAVDNAGRCRARHGCVNSPCRNARKQKARGVDVLRPVRVRSATARLRSATRSVPRRAPTTRVRASRTRTRRTGPPRAAGRAAMRPTAAAHRCVRRFVGELADHRHAVARHAAKRDAAFDVLSAESTRRRTGSIRATRSRFSRCPAARISRSVSSMS